MAFQDRFSNSFFYVDKWDGATVGTCVMWDGTSYVPFDTTDIANFKKYAGVVYEINSKSVFIAFRGVIPLSVADGTYYCDSSGVLFTSLPSGSVEHEICTVVGGKAFLSGELVSSGSIIETLDCVKWTNSFF